MTKLEQRLEADINAAQRGRSSDLGVLRLLKAALQSEAKAKGPEALLDELAVLGVLRRELKKRHEAAKLYEQGGRAELATAEKAEAEIVARYLPPAPSSEDIMATAQRLQAELGLSGPAALGPLTKAVLGHYAGAADGGSVSAAVRQVLGS